MKLRGVPPEGVPTLSYVGSPAGTVVGTAQLPLGRLLAYPVYIEGAGGGVAAWAAITGKPAVIASGADQAAARASISAQLADADLTALAALSAPATKLSGIATGATANDTDANLRARSSHTGTQSADTVTDGTTNKAYTAAEKTKLSGVATGATANSTDAAIRARASHTGTQTASTISDFSTAADARVTAAVGSTVQAYDADLTTWGAKTAPSGTVVGTSDTQTLTTKTLTDPVINNYTEGLVAIGNTGTSKTISLTSGTVQTATLTGNCTFTMPTATAGKSFTLHLNTGAGSFTATFTGVKWPGAAYVATTAASKRDILSFSADGTAWYGVFAQNYTP